MLKILKYASIIFAAIFAAIFASLATKMALDYRALPDPGVLYESACGASQGSLLKCQPKRSVSGAVGEIMFNEKGLNRRDINWSMSKRISLFFIPQYFKDEYSDESWYMVYYFFLFAIKTNTLPAQRKMELYMGSYDRRTQNGGVRLITIGEHMKRKEGININTATKKDINKYFQRMCKEVQKDPRVFRAECEMYNYAIME